MMRRGPGIFALIALIALDGAGRAIAEGTINLAGGRVGFDNFVTYANDRGLFLFGVLSLLAVGVVFLWLAWRAWRG